MPVYALGQTEPRIHQDAYVHPDAVVIGAVVIDAGSSVWPGAVLRGDFGRIEVGELTSIQDGTILHADERSPTTIGSRCIVGHNAHLEGCVVEDGCMIGSMATVLAGAHIGRGALVAAGALVAPRMQVPDCGVAMGVPARIQDRHLEPGAFDAGAHRYAEQAARYRSDLRRLL